MTTETNFRKMLAVAGGLALAVPALSACAEKADDAVVAECAAEEATDAAEVATCAADTATCAAECAATDATCAAGDATCAAAEEAVTE
ncbi:hypothetical protein [Parasphingorhabdus sp.]|uniref:hypothetical protein n=1 Tax=Parasphingorhabdus sp. TaxID=2709688 RepID=UPI003A92547A